MALLWHARASAVSPPTPSAYEVASAANCLYCSTSCNTSAIGVRTQPSARSDVWKRLWSPAPLPPPP